MRFATKISPKKDEWSPSKSSQLDEIVSNKLYYRICREKFKKSWCRDNSFNATSRMGRQLGFISRVAGGRLKQEGKVESFGISVNRWEPTNCIEALKTELIDSVQVIYNVFDQSPENELFSYCQENNIAIIARVPFDEGALTGKLSLDSKWDNGDFRNIYFREENLSLTIERAEKFKDDFGKDVNLAELALKFIASHPAVTTMIPGIRQIRNMEANMNIGHSTGLSQELIHKLKNHKWDRTPTSWSC